MPCFGNEQKKEKQNDQRRHKCLVLEMNTSYFVNKNTRIVTKKFYETDIIKILEFFLLTTYLVFVVIG